MATPPPGGPWYEHYERGVRLISQGQASAALPELQSAASIRSKEGLQVPTRPQQYLDYLPHLYLAIANQMTGDLEAANPRTMTFAIPGTPCTGVFPTKAITAVVINDRAVGLEDF